MNRKAIDELVAWFVAFVFWVGAMQLGSWLFEWAGVDSHEFNAAVVIFLFFAPVLLFHLCADSLARYYAAPLIEDARKDERKKAFTQRNSEHE